MFPALAAQTLRCASFLSRSVCQVFLMIFFIIICSTNIATLQVSSLGSFLSKHIVCMCEHIVCVCVCVYVGVACVLISRQR